MTQSHHRHFLCLRNPRSIALPIGALFVCWFACWPTSASAQGFSVSRFAQPPSTSDGLVLQLPGTPGHLQGSALVTFDLSLSPLVATARSAQDATADLIGHRVQGHGAVSLGLGERFELFLIVPAVLTQGGDDPVTSGFAVPVPASSGLGDVSVGGSALVLGERDEGAQLGVTAALALPTGSTDALAGDDGIGARGGVMLALGNRRLRVAAETGANIRSERAYGQTEVGPELYLRGGVHLGVSDALLFLIEAQGSTRISRFLRKYENPAEALVGLRYQSSAGLNLGLGAGVGLTQAPGVPAFRALLTLGYALTATVQDNSIRVGGGDEEAAPTSAPESTPSAAPVDPDTDRDGLLNEDDRCPTRAEDMDGFEDEDGCPDDDNDRDGVPDDQDRCPNEAEEMTGTGDGDGCPSSTDETQTSEPVAATPARTQTTRRSEPVEDSAIPTPPNWHAVHEALPDPISFDFQSDQLTPEAETTLAEFALFARRYPRVRLLVEGHASLEAEAVERTGERAQLRGNREISEARAERVTRLLVARGVRASSLVTRGLGSSRPIASNETEAGRAQNRRVEVHVCASVRRCPPYSGN